MNIDQSSELTSVAKLPIFYENGSGYMVLSGTKYVSVNEAGARRYLVSRGFLASKAPFEPMSMLDRALMNVQFKNVVDYAGPLAGKKEGIHMIGQSRVLVTVGPNIVEPNSSVSWDLIRRILEEMFVVEGEEQRTYLYGWLSVAYKALREARGTLGQALVLAGPRDSGKTLLQKIITTCLGGRAANPFAYMSGSTPFNRELFGSECLMFGDETSSINIGARRNFGSRLKQFAVNEDQYCHAKGKTAITLRPYWRLVFSVNDEPENLMVLPPLDDSILDKVIILRVARPVIFSSTEWSDDRTGNWKRIEAELPGFIAHINSFKIPKSKSSARFGICEYHDPEIKARLREQAQELHLLDLIDAEMFEGTNCVQSPWRGTATQLESRLRQFGCAVKAQADGLLYWSGAAGTYLMRLCTQYPNRVQRGMKNGKTEYTISPPRAENGAKAIPLTQTGIGDPSPYSRFSKAKTEVVGNGKEGEGPPMETAAPPGADGLVVSQTACTSSA